MTSLANLTNPVKTKENLFALQALLKKKEDAKDRVVQGGRQTKKLTLKEEGKR